MSKMKATTARAAAVSMIETVLDGGMPLSEANVSQLFDPAERARAQRLALGTLRNLAQIDRALKPYLARAPLPAPTMTITPKDNLFAYTLEDFVLEGYEPWPHIKAPVAV